MPDLRDQLRSALAGRVCVAGVGNTDRGDDALGVRLAENLRLADPHDVLIAGTTPERHVDRIAEGEYDVCLYLDAVDFGAEPGAAVFLDAAGIAEKCPQISTHKISLGLLSQLIQGNNRTRVWLLGVQPESLEFGTEMTPRIQASVEALHLVLEELLGAAAPASETPGSTGSPQVAASTPEVTPC